MNCRFSPRNENEILSFCFYRCQQVVKRFHWPEAVTYFNRCYELSIELFQKQPRVTYWSVAATLDYYRLKISQEDRFVNDLLYVATKNAIFANVIPVLTPSDQVCSIKEGYVF
ncbi:hypothetical protein TNIN_256501 [Trichonephila inaurata madagascariensis]|uniref:Uncharacterized protein n=1 Tax=Trichonephila inaurata madagascariensis TaxID=2747483 RepID=A0A8X7CJP5_9ARAC|nr:hypothetical protein TNIN_256501 [Trichonephila inaurata madagascariensis]